MAKEGLFIPDLSLRPEFENRINAAAWENSTGNTILLTREIVKVGAPGEPDVSEFVRLELDSSGNILDEKVVLEHGRVRYDPEDPRALKLKDGQVLVGLTAVRFENGHHVPYPAILTIENADSDEPLQNPEVVIDLGPGKGTMPVDERTYFFRPEGEGNNHKLVAFSWEDKKAKELSVFEFPPVIKDNYWRSGTAMPPIWFKNDEAIMFFHGIKKWRGNWRDFYAYSIHAGKLVRDGDNFAMTDVIEGIITPRMFVDANGRRLIDQLHDNRAVVYLAGGVQRGNGTVDLFPQYGDKQMFGGIGKLAPIIDRFWPSTVDIEESVVVRTA